MEEGWTLELILAINLNCPSLKADAIFGLGRKFPSFCYYHHTGLCQRHFCNGTLVVFDNQALAQVQRVSAYKKLKLVFFSNQAVEFLINEKKFEQEAG